MHDAAAPAFPIMVWFYARLARREEGDMIAAFGDDYRRYARTVPAFAPWLGHASEPKEPKGHGVLPQT